jgi:hypothetical protein
MALFKALFLGATTFLQGENLKYMIEKSYWRSWTSGVLVVSM